MNCCGTFRDAAILNRLQKPARYTGGEYNSITKDWAEVEVGIALAMPDVYEVGLSNLGLKILYEILNNCENIAAERVYAPWTDFEKELRENKLPLVTLESKRRVKDFDVVGFVGLSFARNSGINQISADERLKHRHKRIVHRRAS